MQCKEKVLPLWNLVKQMVGTLESISVEIDSKETAMTLPSELQLNLENFIVAIYAVENEDRLFTFEWEKCVIMR